MQKCTEFTWLRAHKGRCLLNLAKCMDFPGGSDSKASVYNAGDPGSIPGLERSLGEGNGKIPWTEDPGRLQSMGVTKSRTQLSDFTFIQVHGKSL